MNKLGRKKIVFSAIFFMISYLTVTAQFNTLRPKDKINELEAEKMIQDSIQTNTEKAGEIQTVQESTIEEGEKYILNGMHKNQNLALPIDELNVTSSYGYRTDPFTRKRTFHKGIDLNADFNYVYSIMPGKVVKSGKNRALGEFIQVEHGEFVTTYGHLFQRLVSSKEVVEAGQPIGVSGSTGRSTGEHLHFQMSYNGKNIDPLPVLNYIRQIMQEARKELENAIKELDIK